MGEERPAPRAAWSPECPPDFPLDAALLGPDPLPRLNAGDVRNSATSETFKWKKYGTSGTCVEVEVAV